MQTCPGVELRARSCREGLQASRAPVSGRIALQRICVLQIDWRGTGLLPPSVLLPPPDSCSHRSSVSLSVIKPDGAQPLSDKPAHTGV